MKTNKMIMALVATFVALLAQSVCAEEAARDLKWTYAGEEFSAPSNWTWTDSTITEEITAGPGTADRVLFAGSGEDEMKVVKLTSGATVANFIYEATQKGGALVDLNMYTLTATNQVNVKGDYRIASSAPLIFSNGTISVTGTAAGEKVWGHPNEEAGGFFMNRANSMYAAVNLIFDEATLKVEAAPNGPSLVVQGAYSKMSRVHLLNGTLWDLPSFKIVNATNCPVEFVVRASELKLATDLSFDCKEDCDMVFEDNAKLTLGGALRATGGRLLLNGSIHSLGYSQVSGDNGSSSLTGMDVVISNKATLTAQNLMAIRSGSSITVCDGAQLTTSDGLYIGRHPYKQDRFFGDSSLVVDDGTVTALALTLGDYEAYSNNCLRIVGPLSRVETTGTGASGAIAFNYGARIEFEIPAEGYHDAEGNARAPVYANTVFRSMTNNVSRPLALILKTKAFDKKHPKESIVLMQSKDVQQNHYGTYYDTQIEELTNNVVFVDSEKNPGKITISEDKRSLIYTAPIPLGMLISVR